MKPQIIDNGKQKNNSQIQRFPRLSGAGYTTIKSKKNRFMKKIFLFLLISGLASSCYEDYIKDFDYNAVYFTHQFDVRTFVVGEGMKIDVGVAMGGAAERSRDLKVGFQIDPALITPAILTSMKAGLPYIKNAVSSVSALQLLPANYYTLSNQEEFTIKKGEFSGRITLKPDSTAFLSDPATLNATYVLPLLIKDSETDSILHAKNYSVIGFKYESKLFGMYWHGGVTVEKDPAGNVINTIKYYSAIPMPETTVWTLKTEGPFELTANGYSNIRSSKPELKITLNGGNISLDRAVGSTFAFEPDGENIYNNARLLQNRKLFLKYKYQNSAGNWCHATDTLIFRNRLRDGVSEWQDLNPANYD